MVIVGLMCFLTKYTSKNFISDILNDQIHYSTSEKVDESNENIKFYVYDKPVRIDNKIKINRDNKSAQIPVLAMCEAMGAKVIWFGNKVVFIIFEDETYILNIKKETLKKLGSNLDLIAYPPGGVEYVRFYEFVDQEILVDDLSLTRFVRVRNSFIKIDFDSNIIYIDKSD